MKPKFNIKKYWNKYYVDFNINSVYKDVNNWGHFYFYEEQINKIDVLRKIKSNNEFSDLDIFIK